MKQQCEEFSYKEVGALLASAAEARIQFGTSAAVDGNRLVVGAPGKESIVPTPGTVYVYDWNGSAYIEVAQLTASDARAYDQFGYSVTLSGNRLVVGACGEDTAGVKAGKVYAYEWNATTSVYDEVTTITASDAQANDWFGSSVALSGNRLVVGASGEDTAGLNAGKLYIFDWDCTTSTYAEVAQLTASDARAYDYFGDSVSLSGNRLVVGATGDSTADLEAGKVYVYDWNGSAYIEVAQLTASDASTSDWFGRSVALSGDGNRLIVGAQREDTANQEAGKVYIYLWTGDAYIEVAQLTASDAYPSDWFGRSVTIDGTRLVVGACGVSAASLADVGKVYTYDWTGLD